MVRQAMLVAVLAGVAGMGGGSSAAQEAAASDSITGHYDATFSQVANNCSGVGMNLGSLTVDVDQGKNRHVSVTIPSVPIMNGTVSKAGKFRASVKRGKTAIEGVEGRFSVAGKVEKGAIQFLFVAEYFRATKPLCTQSWNATGPRK
jgi:hypothetical protein